MQRVFIAFALLSLALPGGLFWATSPASAWTELTTMPPGPDVQSANCGFLDREECADRVNFSLSSFDTWFGTWVYGSTQGPDLLVNVRKSDGTWRWNPSPQIVDFRDYSDPEATISSSAVIATGTNRFRSPVDGHNYKRVLYFVYQTFRSDRTSGVCVMFSDDASGWTWTAPVNVVTSAFSPARGQLCGTAGGPDINLEAIGGFLLNDQLHLFGPEGDTGLLVPAISTPRTYTYHFTAAQTSPDILVQRGELTPNGLQKFAGSGDDYYNFFINMDASYDLATGSFYATALYPYPYDIDDSLTPCRVGSSPIVSNVCPDSPATFPNRAQVIRMDIDGDFSRLYVGTSRSFELVADFGERSGWADTFTGSCTYRNLTACYDTRWNTGLDFDSLDFFTGPVGLLERRGVDNDEILLLGSAPSGFVDRQDLCDDATAAGASGAGGTFNFMGIYWNYYDLNPGVTSISCP